MPFSSTNGKQWTKRLLNRIIKGFSCKDPTVNKSVNVCDIGAGSGTYIELLSETNHLAKWHGLEVWEPYVEKYDLRNRYDVLTVEDARKWAAGNTQQFDVAIAGDVIEHMTKEESLELYKHLITNSQVVVMSIPIVHYPQDEYEGNPYERHVKDDWSHQEVLDSFNDIVLYFVEGEIGVYVCAINPDIKQYIRKCHDPKIAVYGIFKNEIQFIDRLMQSIHDADQIVLCDTGSTDGTHEKVIQYLRPVDKCAKITVSPWRFDSARNVAMSLIDKDIDLCVSIDADEYLLPGWKQILVDQWEPRYTRYYHRFKTIWNRDLNTTSEHWHDRIHIRTGYTWKLPVHEIIEYRDVEQIKWLPMFEMIQEPDTTKDRSSYLDLLEISVSERPDIWKSWTFLAQEQVAAGNYEAAEASLLNAEQCKDVDHAYIYKLRFYYSSQCGNYLNAIECINKAIRALPGCRELYYMKGLYEFQNGHDGDAYVTLTTGAELPETPRTDYHYDARAYGESYSKLLDEVTVSFKQKVGVK